MTRNDIQTCRVERSRQHKAAAESSLTEKRTALAEKRAETAASDTEPLKTESGEG